MVLVDTSVWINHLRQGDSKLVELLDANQVLIHPLVIGELACGNLENREEILEELLQLPMIKTASDAEVLSFIEHKRLMGRGVGFIDCHLLASVFIEQGVGLVTRDKNLQKASAELSVLH